MRADEAKITKTALIPPTKIRGFLSVMPRITDLKVGVFIVRFLG